MTAPKNNIEEGKPIVSYIPLDLLIPLLCPTYKEGDIKYIRESWREGFNTSVMMDALMRHLTAFYFEGEELDPDSEQHGIKKHHLGAVIFCAICMYDTAINHPELDDRIVKENDNEID